MPFIPLHDDNPRIFIAKPWATWGLILACVLVYLIQIFSDPQTGERLAYGLGLIPATLSGEAELNAHLYLTSPVVTLATYMFLHGGFLHLGGNMLFLWVFGDNIEDAMGHGRFVAFYLLGGVIAGLVQVMLDPASRLPTIGASGAVAAVLGAYLILHPKARILVPILYIPLYLPAYLLLLLWIGFQVFMAFSDGGGGVAWWAHIGGFIAGALLIIPFRHNSLPLFGGPDDLPRGVTLRRKHDAPTNGANDKRRGPWD